MSETVVFSGFGIQIVQRLGRLFIQSDSGGIASWTTDDEITETEAAKARRSEHDAYEVLLEIDRRRGR